MFIFVGKLLYPACPKCEKRLDEWEILDSLPPYYVWWCECGYQEGHSVFYPMTEEQFHQLIRNNITLTNL